MLRSRRTRREASLETHLPDPVVSPEAGLDPEQEALLGDSVGLAMLVVLDALTPAERVAFVLHDVFAVPFDEIAPIVGRTPAASRQLASRARRRVQGAPEPDVDLDGQWAVVDAFIAAARDGDFERLLAVLDPDVVLRSDGGDARPGLIQLVRGSEAVAGQAMSFRQFGESATRVLVNGIPGGIAWAPDGSPFAVLALTVRGGRIVRIDVLADPDRLGQLDLTVVAASPERTRSWRLNPMSDRIADTPDTIPRGVPPWVRLFSPVLKALLGAGVPLGLNGLVTIRGRTSGQPRTAALAVVTFEGRRWVWAPWGEVHWVRNLRAAGRATVKVRGRSEEVTATELDPTQRVEFFRDVLRPVARSIPFGVSFIRVVDGVDLADPAAAAEGRSVFELHPLA